jgi:glycosyltransferase involved in cell wall biosynthesis
MRLLMTLDAVGGVWRYALDAAAALRERGVTCLLVGFGPPPDAARRDACAALPDVELIWTEQPLDWMVQDEAALEDVGDTLARLAAEWRADLLHLNLPSQAAELATDRPVVVAAHSCVPTWWAQVRGTPLPPEWSWQLRRNRRGLHRADVVLVPTASHGEAAVDAYGRPDRLQVVLNTSSAPFSRQPKEPLVLAAGRWWDEAKNGAVLDAAAAASMWPVMMAGPLAGPGGAALAPRHAQTLGEVSAARVLALMQRAAVFAAPSVYEPFGLAVLEAACSGCVLVLSDIPSFRELWDGAAMFVAARDAAAWTEALNTLAVDPQRREALAAQAHRRAAAIRSKPQADALLAAYRTCQVEAA